jgi:hypothetical protein
MGARTQGSWCFSSVLSISLCSVFKCPIIVHVCFSLSLSLFSFGWCWGLNLGLTLANRWTCPKPSLLYLLLFYRECCALQSVGLDLGPPLAGITGTHHHSWLVGWDDILLTFFLGWLQTTVLLPRPPEEVGLQGWATMPSLIFAS